MLKPDLLQGHQVLGEFAPPFEDRGVRSLKAQTGDVRRRSPGSVT